MRAVVCEVREAVATSEKNPKFDAEEAERVAAEIKAKALEAEAAEKARLAQEAEELAKLHEWQMGALGRSRRLAVTAAIARGNGSVTAAGWRSATGEV